MNIFKWKEFKISDLFDVKSSQTTKKEDLEMKYGLGEYPYITTKATNNGVENYYDFYTEESNVLTIDSAVSGYVTYQDKEFTASDHVEVLKPKKTTMLNRNTALFLKTIIEKSCYKYAYGRKFNQARIKETSIILPVNELNNPDWDYIYNYIDDLEKKNDFKKIRTQNRKLKNRIEFKNWKLFKITDLFDIKGYGSISSVELENKGVGEYPYVTRTEQNNGISGFYDYKTAPKNVLTIETTLSGLCFYHDYEFSTGDHIMVLEPKEGVTLNKYTAMFIKTIWRKNAYKYDYNRPAIKENIVKTSLILPCKGEKPDWEYMEEFVKKLPYGDLI